MSDDQFLEKRCSKCGNTKPIESFNRKKDSKDGYHSICKVCRAAYRAANAQTIREYDRAWRAANPEYDRAYYAANAQAMREYSRTWRAANPEYNRAYYAANAQAMDEYNCAWRSAHPDARRKHGRAYQATHPDVYRAANHRRRARIKGNGGNVTAYELAAKRASQNGVCFYCQMQHTPDELTIDHVIPIDQGGPHIIANIVFACGICNSSKGNRTPEQWTDRWYQRLKR